jgi:hypothetical protein
MHATHRDVVSISCLRPDHALPSHAASKCCNFKQLHVRTESVVGRCMTGDVCVRSNMQCLQGIYANSGSHDNIQFVAHTTFHPSPFSTWQRVCVCTACHNGWRCTMRVVCITMRARMCCDNLGNFSVCVQHSPHSMSIFSVAVRHSGGVFSPGMVSLKLTQTTKPLDWPSANSATQDNQHEIPEDDLRWTAGGQTALAHTCLSRGQAGSIRHAMTGHRTVGLLPKLPSCRCSCASSKVQKPAYQVDS